MMMVAYSFGTSFILFIHSSCTDISAPGDRSSWFDGAQHSLTLASVEEIRRIIVTSPYDLVPIPTTMLKDSLDVLLTSITSFVKIFLSEGVLPGCSK